MQPARAQSEENTLEATLCCALEVSTEYTNGRTLSNWPHLFKLRKECQDLHRHVTATMEGMEVVRTYDVSLPAMLIYRITQDQLREDVRRLQEEMQQISADRAKFMSYVLEDDLPWLVALVISVAFYLYNKWEERGDLNTLVMTILSDL